MNSPRVSPARGLFCVCGTTRFNDGRWWVAPVSVLVMLTLHPLRRLIALCVVTSLLILAAACTGTPVSQPSAPATVTATTATKPTVVVLPAAEYVGDGIWTVGSGVSPGLWQPTADVPPKCYWWIYESGHPANESLDHVISFGQPGSGRPQVKLEADQVFQVWRCGTWSKVG